jgi:2-amino-4-hydroxy-6-hydroxymethyldihydropteridine diphosphokinase
MHATKPVGRQAGGPFCNAAIRIETDAAPLELLDRLQSLEADAGRVRTLRWGPRPLDLDLILYGESTLVLRADGDAATSDADVRLVVPHPDAWYRLFVLDPAVEIAGELPHPTRRGSIKTLRDRLGTGQIGLVSQRAELVMDVIRSLRATHPATAALLHPIAYDVASDVASGIHSGIHSGVVSGESESFSAGLIAQLDPVPRVLAHQIDARAAAPDKWTDEPIAAACKLYSGLPVEKRVAIGPGQNPIEFVRDLATASFRDAT